MIQSFDWDAYFTSPSYVNALLDDQSSVEAEASFVRALTAWLRQQGSEA